MSHPASRVELPTFTDSLHMLGVEQAIATSLGMSWNVQAEGDYRVITVSRR